MKTFSIYTFGCKVNQYEEEKLRQFLLSLGLKESKDADVAFVNTCTVTHLADRKARQKIRQLCQKNKMVIVVGCGARNSESFKNLEKKDNIIFLRDKDFYKELKKLIIRRGTTCGAPTRQKRSRALIKAQDGCNRYCTYCIVPYVRGDIKSRTPDEILTEIRKMEEAGFKEIVITGVNLGLYGADLDKKINLTGLLKYICDNTKIPRVRISSIEPDCVDAELINFIKTNKRVCPHFHIPLQHASDKILKLMNRPYKLKDYDKIIRQIIKEIPSAAISSDILTGFPGEEEEDFKILYEYVKKTPFSRLHVFKYSERPFTKAKDLKNKVPENIKSERSRILIKLAEKKLKEYNDGFTGKVVEVLVEDTLHKSGYLQGYTPNYIQVLIEVGAGLVLSEVKGLSRPYRINEIVSVELYKKDAIIFGRIIK